MSDVQERKFGGCTLRILRDECIGTGACVTAVPQVLELDDRQSVTFVPQPSDPGAEPLADACRACPVDALELMDEKGPKLAP